MWQSTTSRISAGGESVHPEKSARPGRTGRWLAAGLLLLLSAMLPSLAWAAAYATGGSSLYRNTVLWLTWGGGTDLGTHGVTLNNGDTSSISMPIASGIDLNVTCSLANISGGGLLQSYRPGDFSGDSLDDLYNVGGTGGANQLIAGISRSSGTSSFEINCVSTLGGTPYRLRGVVMADAESINNSGEFVEATARGTWNVVEVRKNVGAGPYNVTKSMIGANSVVRFGPGNDNNTAAVTFLNFDNAAHAPGNFAVNMGFSMRGSGTTAIAIGLLVPYADFGDAPQSYGDAMHVVDDLQFRPDGLPVNATPTNINTAGYTPGGLAPPLIDFLGTVGPDTEQKSSYSVDAKGDDNFPAGNPNEENAWPTTYTLTVMQAGAPAAWPAGSTSTATAHSTRASAATSPHAVAAAPI